MNFIKYSSNQLVEMNDFITLSRARSINLSKSFLIKNVFSKSREKYASLFFDPENKAIALRFSPSRDNDSFSVTYDKDNQGASISCGNFLNAFKIEPHKYAGRYKYEQLEDPNNGKLFVFKLGDHKNGTN